jgi:hypothetical protein
VSTSKSIQKVDYAIYQDPSLIPVLFRDTSIPKGLLYSRLRRAVPHRIGIEFEGVGEFLNNYLKDHGRVFKSESSAADYFGVKEIRCDTAIGCYSNKNPGSVEELPIEEVRVSIESFKQLSGLKKVLDELSKYLMIVKGCGIHIHIDMSDYLSSSREEYKDNVVNYLNHRLPEIESIFPKYKGKYNKRVAKIGKQSYVNVSMHNTLEFRIAPLTFDYAEIIQWIVKCSKLASKVIQQCHLKPISQDVHKSKELSIGVPEDVPELVRSEVTAASLANIYLTQINDAISETRIDTNAGTMTFNEYQRLVHQFNDYTNHWLHDQDTYGLC